MGEQLRHFATFSEGVHHNHNYGKCENKNYTVMIHTQVNFSVTGDRGPVAGCGGRVGKWYLTW